MAPLVRIQRRRPCVPRFQRSRRGQNSTVPLAVLGYGIEVRSPDEALVTIAASLPSDAPRTITTWPLVMIWADGDWKVKPPSNDRWGQ